MADNLSVYENIIQYKSLGLNNKQIAKRLNISERQLYRYFNNDTYKTMLSEYINDVFASVKSSYLPLLETCIIFLQNKMRDGNEELKTKIALAIVKNGLTLEAK
jgi:orotate phosphoribosyltransferase-like protein